MVRRLKTSEQQRICHPFLLLGSWEPHFGQGQYEEWRWISEWWNVIPFLLTFTLWWLKAVALSAILSIPGRELALCHVVVLSRSAVISGQMGLKWLVVCKWPWRGLLMLIYTDRAKRTDTSLQKVIDTEKLCSGEKTFSMLVFALLTACNWRFNETYESELFLAMWYQGDVAGVWSVVWDWVTGRHGSVGGWSRWESGRFWHRVCAEGKKHRVRRD